MKYMDLMKKRESIREYRKKKVEEETLEKIRAYFPKAKRLFPEIGTELMIFTDEAAGRLEGTAGYKGYSFGAPAYLVILSAKKDHYLENAGYLGEDMLLKMTDCGLDGCWLTVGDGDMVKHALLFKSDLEVVSIFACGYRKKDPLMKRIDILNPSGKAFKKRSGHAAPKIAQTELVFDHVWNCPVDWDGGSIDSTLDQALYGASLAPSFLNRQPYRYIIGDKLLLLCTTKEEMTSDEDRGLDCGATMLNFDMAYSLYGNESNHWRMGTPPSMWDAKLPEEYYVVAYYDL